MADQEVAKHTKKVFSLLAQDQHSFWHKVREILLEILIIIFAVSMSIWLHAIGEHRHEQQQVKTFLLGLKNDLQVDIEGTRKTIQRFRQASDQFKYLASLDPAATPDAEKFDIALEAMELPLFDVFYRKGRYDSFKTSGRLANIENEALLEDIVLFYESGTNATHLTVQYWNANRELLKNYIDNGADAGGAAARFKLIVAPKGKRLTKAMEAGPLKDLEGMVQFESKIIGQIDAMFPGEAAAHTSH